MSLSRRAFVRTLGVGGTGALSATGIAARGREALVGEFGRHALVELGDLPLEARMQMAGGSEAIRISSNENPLGPGKAAVDAIVATFASSNRYPMNTKVSMISLRTQIGQMYGAKAESVILGDGSGEILDNATRCFTSPGKPLVNASPSYLATEQMAQMIGTPVKRVPLTNDLKLDLDAMLAASKGAGLVFVCNPNNPTATAHTHADISSFVTELRKSSPETAILIDEAYIDYATAPGVKTAADLALANPNVFIARTFSKAFGMAGLRIGYSLGQAETMKKLDAYTLTFGTNVLALAAASASLNDPAHLQQEKERNTAARKFTMDWFSSHGFQPTDSQTNFVFVNIGRPAKDFRDACREHNVMVGRDFPPMEKTHARISIGTMDEMKKAVEVFGKVLGTATTSASRG